MTLWHLLVGIASIAPLIQALKVGAKAGIVGILIGLVVGVVLHVLTFLGLNVMGNYVAPTAFKLRSGGFKALQLHRYTFVRYFVECS